MGPALWLFCCGWFLSSPGAGASPPGWMVKLRLGDRTIEGAPLAWDANRVHLLGRDGRLWEFSPREAAEYRRTSNRFRSYSVSQLRAMLLGELGTGYEVTGTSHYLVAHPRGQRDRWANRFEQLYRSFHQYFSVRGFRLHDPPFPLIGLVCADREQFQRYAAMRQGMAGPGVLGYYSVRSNRIVLYDQTAGPFPTGSWADSAATVIHEATHQTAFNTGIHSRYALPPTWVAEGLATLFEAPGVYDCRYHRHRSDRINRGRLQDFLGRVRPAHNPDLLRALVCSDRLFRVDPAVAYAEAWALTFFLVETRPSDYADYLSRTAARPPFRPYPSDERLADFEAVFGSDWRMLEARLLRFLDGV